MHKNWNLKNRALLIIFIDDNTFLKYNFDDNLKIIWSNCKMPKRPNKINTVLIYLNYCIQSLGAF